MRYTTVIPSPLFSGISYSDQIVTIGSCFADQIGNKLVDNRFLTCQNPFGTSYNPYTICQHLHTTIHGLEPNPLLYVQKDGLWCHHAYHSSFVSETMEELKRSLLERSRIVLQQLSHANFLLITLGSAIVYRHIATNHIVGNCHKVPGDQFVQELMTSRAIVTRMSSTLEGLWDINPNLQVILTVSPVRYLKDGAVQNSRSKAQLITSAMMLEDRHHKVAYWPAYEIFMDELRDYRWVDSDMVHPNSEAVDIIWKAFTESAMSRETLDLLNQIGKLNQQLAHRPFNPHTEAHKKFVQNLKASIADLNANHPEIPFDLNEVTDGF